VQDNSARRGTILVTVLWLLALLSALVMATSATFRGFVGIMNVDQQKVQIEGLWTAGLEVAAGVIAVLDDAPLLNREATIALGSGRIHIELEDEGGRVDVGKAPVEVLTSLFLAAGAPQPAAVARQIVAWREIKQERPLGEGEPADADGNDGTVSRSLTDLGQLLQVPGMRPESVAAIRPLATVFGDATVNPLTAPARVLAALPGVEPARLRMFVEMRERNPVMAARSLSLLGEAQRFLSVRPPRAVSVLLQAKTSRGAQASVHAVIVQLSGDKEPYRVLAWDPLIAADDAWPGWR
jgi:general secretion pathway protein K